MPSAVIRSLRYRPAERLLDITFRDARGVYRYFDVPRAEWEAFRSAASKGTYLNQVFKGGGYGYEKLAGVLDASAALQSGVLRSGVLQSGAAEAGAAEAGDRRKEIAEGLVWGCNEGEEG